MPAPSLSSHPHAQFLSLFLTLSPSFPAPLPFHSDTLHALCVPFDKRPSRGRSGAISVHLIHFPLITQPLSEQRTHVCGGTGCLLGFVCPRLFICLPQQTELMEKRTGPITASAWPRGLSVSRSVNDDPSLDPITHLCHINCFDQFFLRQFLFFF